MMEIGKHEDTLILKKANSKMQLQCYLTRLSHHDQQPHQSLYTDPLE